MTTTSFVKKDSIDHDSLLVFQKNTLWIPKSKYQYDNEIFRLKTVSYIEHALLSRFKNNDVYDTYSQGYHRQTKIFTTSLHPPWSPFFPPRKYITRPTATVNSALPIHHSFLYSVLLSFQYIPSFRHSNIPRRKPM